MKELIEETFKLIRESKELGLDSYSSFDECYDDEELRVEIQELIEENPSWTAEDIFKWFIEIEEIRFEREMEYSGW